MRVGRVGGEAGSDAYRRSSVSRRMKWCAISAMIASVTQSQPLTRGVERARARESRKRRAREAGAARGDAYMRSSVVRFEQPRPIALMSVTPVSLTRERKGSNARARESRKRRAREAGAARGDEYRRSISTTAPSMGIARRKSSSVN